MTDLAMNQKLRQTGIDTQNSSRQVEEFCEFLKGQHAQDVVSMEIASLDALADAMIICGATSRRHAQGLADGLRKICREKNYEVLGMEGYESAEWILLDCNNIIAHIFQEEPRKLYRLEDLWMSQARRPGGNNDTDIIADS